VASGCGAWLPHTPWTHLEEVHRHVLRVDEKPLRALQLVCKHGSAARNWDLFGSALKLPGHAACRQYCRVVEADGVAVLHLLNQNFLKGIGAQMSIIQQCVMQHGSLPTNCFVALRVFLNACMHDHLELLQALVTMGTGASGKRKRRQKWRWYSVLLDETFPHSLSLRHLCLTAPHVAYWLFLQKMFTWPDAEKAIMLSLDPEIKAKAEGISFLRYCWAAAVMRLQLRHVKRVDFIL
jgi:hypothetical protein